MTLGQLCAYYNCSAKTMKNWIAQVKDQIGPKLGHLYTPRQVRIIVEYVDGISRDN